MATMTCLRLSTRPSAVSGIPKLDVASGFAWRWSGLRWGVRRGVESGGAGAAGRSIRGAGANYLPDAGGDAIPLLESVCFCETGTFSFLCSYLMQKGWVVESV
jgi:hypothetical protein